MFFEAIDGLDVLDDVGVDDDVVVVVVVDFDVEGIVFIQL